MYDFEWHPRSRAYRLLTKTGKFVASEIRPVYAQELLLYGADAIFDFNHEEELPLLWGKHNSYIHKGTEVAKIKRDDNGAFNVEPIDEGQKKIKLEPIDLAMWLEINSKIMDALVADTLKRIKEMYDAFPFFYII